MYVSDVEDFCEVTLKIDGPLGGFTEKHRLIQSLNLSNAKTTVAQIVTARAKVLARYHSIMDVTYSMYLAKRDARHDTGLLASAFGPSLLGAEMTNPEEADDTGEGLLFRFNSLDGKKSDYLLKGIRDSWVASNKKTIGAATVYAVGGPYLVYTPPDTEVHLVGNLMSILRDVTALYTPVPSSTLFHNYTFDEFQYRKVGHHDLGARIRLSRGRQSNMA